MQIFSFKRRFAKEKDPKLFDFDVCTQEESRNK